MQTFQDPKLVRTIKPNISFETPKSLEIITHLFLTSLKTFTDKNTSDLMDVMGFTAHLTDVLGFIADLTDVTGFTLGLLHTGLDRPHHWLVGTSQTSSRTSWTSSWSLLRFLRVPFVQTGTVLVVLGQILYCGHYTLCLFTISLVPGLFVLVSLVPISFFCLTELRSCSVYLMDLMGITNLIEDFPMSLMDVTTSWTSSWSTSCFEQ